MGKVIKMHPTPAPRRSKGNVDKKGLELERKVREYRRVLKNDGDFDYGFILIMLQYKLRRTREHIIKHNILMDATKIGAQIQVVEKLLQRVIDDKYEAKYWRKLERKHGKTLFKSRRKDIANEVISASEMAFEDRKADLKKAFDIILEQIWHWWD